MNSLDVDKIDYLQRDNYYINNNKGLVDCYSLYSSARVIDNHISYCIDNINAVQNVFDARTFLFNNHYCSDIVSSLDLMISDVFFKSNDFFQYDKILQDKDEYCQLTDKIRKSKVINNIVDQIHESTEPELKEARKIVDRIFTKDFYQCVGSQYFETANLGDFQKITSERISEYTGGKLSPGDLRVEIKKFNSSLKEKDPVLHVTYFEE